MKEGNKKIILFLILGLIVHQHHVNSKRLLPTVPKTGKLGQAVQLIEFAWTAFEIFGAVQDAVVKEPSTADIIEATQEISDNLDKWGNKLEAQIQESVDKLLNHLPLQGKISADVQLLTKYVGRINELYTDFVDYLKYPEDYSTVAIDDLVKPFTSRDGGDVQNTIFLLHALVVPQGVATLKESLFELLAKETQEFNLDACDTSASPQQRIVELYNIAIEAEKKAFTMTGFGYSMIGHNANETVRGVLRRTREKLVTRANRYRDFLKKTMSQAPRLFRRCDPPKHERGVTFFEFERFMQGYLTQEGALQSDSLCPTKCSGHEWPSDVYFGCDGYGCKRNQPTACRGRLINCAGNNEEIEICEAGSSGGRRYHWFRSKNDDVYGDDTYPCTGKRKKVDQVTIRHGENDELESSCDVCKCICVEDTTESKSNHFISLRDVVTDVENNMVATGLAFVIKDQIAYIKVMQGKLGPEAEVLRNSTDWVEEETIEYNWEESNLYITNSDSLLLFRGKTPGNEWEEFYEDDDVAVLKLTERRINLDTITLDPNYVVTGIRFSRYKKEEEKPIYLEVQGTRFDEETFELDPSSSIWVGPNDMKYAKIEGIERIHYEHEESKNPVDSKSTTIVSRPYSSIDIGMSSMKLDAGQTVIPLLDGLPVVSNPPVALVSVGLYHKKQSGYGGLLTFMVETLDRQPYI